MKSPPPTTSKDFLVPLVHRIRTLYKNIYRLGKTIPKRDKLGIHATLEAMCLDMLTSCIEAAFTRGLAKKPMLEALRLKAEVEKQLVRTEQELGIITEAVYLELGKELVEISKMTTGWIQSLTQKPEKEPAAAGSFS